MRLTCSCFNNKKISTEEFLKIFSIKDSLSIFFSQTYLNRIIEDKLICKKHNKRFKGFSKFYLNNYCEKIFEFKYEKFENDIINNWWNRNTGE